MPDHAELRQRQGAARRAAGVMFSWEVDDHVAKTALLHPDQAVESQHYFLLWVKESWPMIWARGVGHTTLVELSMPEPHSVMRRPSRISPVPRHSDGWTPW